MSISKKDIVCIIPARGGSKGLPRKNIRLIDNEALIVRPIRHAIESGAIGTILVTTDDNEIASIAKNAGAIVPFLRPSNLSEDLTTTEDTLKHALLTYEKMKKNPNLESVFSGHATHKNFWERQEDGSWKRIRNWMSVYSSRQIRRNIIREDTGLMCVSRASLWREGRRIGDKVDVIVNDDDFTNIDIHQEEDLAVANYAIKLRSKN